MITGLLAKHADLIASAANLFTILGVAGAIIGAIIAYNSFRDTKNRKKIENAVSLAKYHADVLIPESIFLRRLLEFMDTEGNYLNIISKRGIKDFSQKEMLNIFEAQYDDIKKMWDKISVNDILSAKLQCCDDNDNFIRILELKEKYDKEEQELKEKHSTYELGKYGEAISKENARFLRNLANKLEWFAMNFTQKIADEKAVYRSLHQNYLYIVECLYYIISKHNFSKSDEYYANIKELYKTWNDRYQDHLKWEKEDRERLEREDEKNNRKYTPKEKIS